MGWARGFQVGSEMGRSMIDTYRQARQQRELRDIREARPEESMGYTAEQGQQLEAIAGAINPETGQPYYQIEAIPGTSQYRVTPNFQVAGAEGQMQQAMPVTMDTQRVTDYLGRRYEGSLSPEQQERAQYRAMADVIAQASPEGAARLRMAISQEERAEKEFEQTSELRGMQIGKARREQTIQSRIDAVVEEEEKNIATARTVFTTRGLEGGAAELKKRGLPVRFNNGAIEVLDNKGKVVERITDLDQAISRTEELIQADMADRLARISGDPAVIRQAVQDRFNRQIQERQLKIQEDEAPLRQQLTRAQIKQVETATTGADLEQKDKAEYRELRGRILKLLENPTAENQTELRQLARRAAILNPKEVLAETSYTDENGFRQTIVTNRFTGEVQQSAREAGVAPPEIMAAARSGTNPVTGKPFTQAEIAEFQRKYPNTPWPGQQTPPAPAGGRTSALPTARPSPAATIRQAQGLPPRIPEPPPREITRTSGRGGGSIRAPNPAYAEWERQYGEAYRAQQR
jgi:hypothetical protein